MILQASHLVKYYGNNKVIKDVSLNIEAGSFTSVTGESGSGKTTLLYLLSGIEKPDGGSVIIDGCDITSLNEKALAAMRRHVFSFVFQFDNLLPNLTILENVMLPLAIAKTAGKAGADRAAELLENIGLAGVMKQRPSEVSGGQQQRASIARALVTDPKIIFLDEPTGSLDSENNEQIMDLLVKLNEIKGMTIIQVTHSQKNAERAGTIVKIKDGAILNV